MNFASDNAGPVHPQVMEALRRVNEGYDHGYGNDPETEAAKAALRALFDAPQAEVFLMPGGTAANALTLGTLVQPWQAVYCSGLAHIHVDECGAPEFYTGGAKLVPVVPGDQITPEALQKAWAFWDTGDVHQPSGGALSVTNTAERGNTYTLDELRVLFDMAHSRGLTVHLDGARFANAVARLGCTPAEMSWKIGADAVVFGGTKNGCMGVEAVLFFDPEKARGLPFRRMRSGHLLSKHRYLAAQMNAYLADGLWLELARKANATCAMLVEGMRHLGVEITTQTPANLIYFRLPLRTHETLQAKGAVYYHMPEPGDGPDDMVRARLVCDWNLSEDAVTRFLETLKAAL
ncbi:threonine aldolase family protein [Sagittula salina]|uniref:Low specificity L-threonine aldolase n=1 Tax=Sagittula salina TaxID=2820268 RepID=A0A940MS77_9RHOB|nr:beta-eliminating lyase-related protein [Sagittula salina]MBP0483728.1 low specificity L-threonine aldolase [Sagittula salina]